MSFAAAGLAVGASISISAIINVVVNRTVHWHWVDAMALMLLGALTLALRQRWI